MPGEFGPPPPWDDDREPRREDPRTIQRRDLGDIIDDTADTTRVIGLGLRDLFDNRQVQNFGKSLVRVANVINPLDDFARVLDGGAVGRNSELSEEYRQLLRDRDRDKVVTIPARYPPIIVPPIIVPVPGTPPAPPPPFPPAPPPGKSKKSKPQPGNDDSIPGGGTRSCKKQFEPGQCEGVNYELRGTYAATRCDNGVSETNDRFLGNYWGPITDIRMEETLNVGSCLFGPNAGASTNNYKVFVDHHTAQGVPATTELTFMRASGFLDYIWSVDIIPPDGVVDECGEPVNKCEPPTPDGEPDPPTAPPDPPQPDIDEDPPLTCPDPCPDIPPCPDLDLQPVLEGLAVLKGYLDVAGSVNSTLEDCEGNTIFEQNGQGASIVGLYAMLQILANQVAQLTQVSCSISEPVVAIPESWQMPDRLLNVPQIVLQFKEYGDEIDDSFIRGFAVPYWNNTLPTAQSLPTWTRGDWRGVLRLPTGGNIIVYADTAENAENICRALGNFAVGADDAPVTVSRTQNFIKRKYELRPYGYQTFPTGRAGNLSPASRKIFAEGSGDDG